MDRLAVELLIKLGRPVGSGFVKVHEALVRCNRRMPCSAFVGLTSTGFDNP